MTKRITTLLLLVCCFANSHAQDMLGTWGSNYGGVSSAIQNPAFIANSKLYADINLVGANFGYYHNDSYIEETNSYMYDFLHLNKYGFPKQDAKTNYLMNHEPEFEKAFITSRQMGPGFMLNVGRNAFAVSFSVRQAASISGLLDPIANLIKHGTADLSIIAHGPFSVTKPIRLAGMVWDETAFTYARVLKSDTKDIMTLGATVKYLTSIGGAYLYIKNVDFAMNTKNILSITNANASLGLSLPIGYNQSKSDFGYNSSYKFGKGFGTDLGFTIQHNTENHYVQRFSRLCEQEFQQYDYRLAVSLIDLGYITFKNNAISGSVVSTKTINYNIANYQFFSVQGAVDTINKRFNPADSSLTRKKFTIYTPTSLSFQYDKRITDKIYVTAAGIIGIPISKNAIKRPSQLAIIPRYESDIFEVSLPLSLYDFTKPRLGLSARIFFLTLGTDRLISLSGVHDYYGYDFYASVRLNFMRIFRMKYLKGQCRESLTHPCF
jgi:hypothetical protein